jgi:uncharacterized membrane protein YgcG
MAQPPVSAPRRPTILPEREVFTNIDEEEETEEVLTPTAPQPAPPPPAAKTPAAPKRKAPEPASIDPSLTGIDLYKALLLAGKICGSSTILHCQALNLSASDLHLIFPNITVETLQSTASLIINLRALEEMNRVAEAKSTSSSSKVTMDNLIANRNVVTKPRDFAAFTDDLSLENTHPRMFHRLPLSTMQKMFMKDAAEHLDMTPISGYNLSDINGASHVKERGWLAVQNPGIHDVTIKDFVQRSFSSQHDKRLKLDGELSLIDNSGIKDAENIKSLKKAVILLIRLMHQSHPLLLNYHTLLHFLVDTDWMYSVDKKNLSQVKYATGFVDFYLAGIGDNYRSITPPPTKTELATILHCFHDSISGPTPGPGRNNRNNGGGNGSGSSGGSNSGGSNSGGSNSGGNGSRGRNNSEPVNNAGKTAKEMDLCKYYNLASGCNRPNPDNISCNYPESRRWKHKCNKLLDSGNFCMKNHAAATNH